MDDPDLAEKMKAEIEGIFLWAFAGLQRLVANNFKFTESQRTRENREAVKRDNNNVFNFLESEGYIRLKADASISSKDCYDIYRMWCEENSLTALKRRSFSDALVATCGKYNLEHCNTITNSAGRRYVCTQRLTLLPHNIAETLHGVKVVVLILETTKIDRKHCDFAGRF